MRPAKDLELLTLIAKNMDMTCSDLAIKRDVTVGAINQQIGNLKREKLIKWDGIKNKRNKRHYLVDYDSLSEHFIEFCFKKTKTNLNRLSTDLYNHFESQFSYLENEVKKQDKTILKQFIKSLIKTNKIDEPLSELWFKAFAGLHDTCPQTTFCFSSDAELEKFKRKHKSQDKLLNILRILYELYSWIGFHLAQPIADIGRITEIISQLSI